MSDHQSRVLQLEQRVAQLESSLASASTDSLGRGLLPKRKPVDNSRSSVASGWEVSSQSSVSTLYASDAGRTKSASLEQRVQDMSEQASLQGSALSRQSRQAVDRWFQNIDQTSLPHTVAPSDASRTPSSSTIGDKLDRMSLRSQSSHDTLRTSTTSTFIEFEAEISWRRYQKARKLMALMQYQQAIPHLEKTLEVIKKLEQRSNTNLNNVRDAFSKSSAQFDVVFWLALGLVETESDHARAQKLLLELIANDSNETAIAKANCTYLLAVSYLTQSTPDPTTAQSICLETLKQEFFTMDPTSQETQMLLAMLVACCYAAGDSDAEIWEELLTEEIKWQGVFGTEIYTADLAYRFWGRVTNQLPADQAQSVIWNALQSGYKWIATPKNLCKQCFVDCLCFRHPAHGPFAEGLKPERCSDLEAHADTLPTHSQSHMTIAYLSGSRLRGGTRRECVLELETIMRLLDSEKLGKAYNHSTALEYALLANNTDTVRFLKSKGTVLNEPIHVLNLAAQSGKTELMKELMTERSTFTGVSDRAGNTILHYAVGDPQSLEFFVAQFSGLVNNVNKKGQSPLDAAAAVNLESAVILTRHGATKRKSPEFWSLVNDRTPENANAGFAISLASKLLSSTGGRFQEGSLSSIRNKAFRDYLHRNYSYQFK